jgi:hypothetical protein
MYNISPNKIYIPIDDKYHTADLLQITDDFISFEVLFYLAPYAQSYTTLLRMNINSAHVYVWRQNSYKSRHISLFGKAGKNLLLP